MEGLFKSFLLSVLFLFILPLNSYGQESDCGVFVEFGGNVGVNHYPHCSDRYYGVLTPGIGFTFNSKINLGVRVGIECGEYRYRFHPKFSLYGQYNFLSFGKFKVFVEPKIAFAQHSIVDTGSKHKDNPSRNLWECGFSLGGSFSFAKNFSVQLRYPYVGYSHFTYLAYYSDTPGRFGNDSWCVDLGIRRLELSFRYQFSLHR